MTEPELLALRARITDVDLAASARAQLRLDGKTKPRRSLGRLEELACRVAAIRGEEAPAMPDKALVVMAADHGVAAEGVSAFPAEVTAQMVVNFARGGAALNVLARRAGARVIVVDMGVKAPLPAEGVRSLRVSAGTRNLAVEPAMSRDEVLRAIGGGAAIAQELAQGGVTLIGIGEMGIGNTTSASALTQALLGLAPEEVAGRGTGIDHAGLERKLAVLRRATERHRLGPASAPLEVLRCLGGFEVAGLAGVVLGCAAARVPVIVDGFIASVAALCAVRIAPRAQAYLLPSHLSVEAGHRHVLQALELRPLLQLDMRLGEGTGAALAMGLVDAALAILHEMATFAGAGVSDSGR